MILESHDNSFVSRQTADWLEFQSRQRREREAEELQERLKVARRREVAQAILVALLVAVIGLSLIGVVLMAAIASRRM